MIAMSAQPPTKVSDAAPEKHAENKYNPFQPEMPNIPGVSDGSHHAKRGLSPQDSQKPLQIAGAVIVVVLAGAIFFWWSRSKPRGVNPAPTEETVEQTAPPPPPPIAPVHDGPTVAATVDELSKPWSAKKFTFIKPITQENISAIVIRLPGEGLWAFSLQGPFGRCELEFVTDLPTLASKYRFKATHPMVVNPCDSTVYDPLKVGDVGGSTWVRGQIVQGSSLRPPISIDVKARGRFIVAEGIE